MHLFGRRFLRALAGTTVVAAMLAVSAPAQASHSAGHRAQQRAEQLRERAAGTASALSDAKGELASLAARANAALDAYQRAAFAARAAAARQVDAEAQLSSASRAVTAQQRQVAAYVSQIYRGNTVGGTDLLARIFATGDPSQVLDMISTAKRVGEQQGEVLVQLRVAQLQVAQAQRVAAQAAAGAADSARQAGKTKAAADALVSQQQQQVAALNSLYDQQTGAATAATQRAKQLARAEALARQRAARAVPSVTGTCRGGDVSGYPNGQIPRSALCPLWGASGQLLRADAAARFNDMSRAFATVFGAPICVTDSYRSYAEQEQLYAEKPAMAAEPGKSQHGWGLAADLCGGIQNDGTSTNSWLRDNAGRFGWFHPSWADPGGGGPYEPWHWEYAGG